MHLTMIMPVVIIAVAGITCLAVRRETFKAQTPETTPLPEASQAAA
jgi:hypothetical protein